jgi:hypothetical protein|tara:strand:+ start:346 stop:546 length:201 start_codon:yes stop_codon:yes gene_type:complete
MTFILFGQTLTFEFRNGVGVDLEFTTSKPVWITRDNSEFEVAEFEGMVIGLPFIVISFGLCYSVED